MFCQDQDEGNCLKSAYIKFYYTPRKQSLGGYIGITLSVRPCTL